MRLGLLGGETHGNPQLVSGFLQRPLILKCLSGVGVHNCQPGPEMGDCTKVSDRTIHIALLKQQLSQGVLRVCVARIEFDCLFKGRVCTRRITVLHSCLTALIRGGCPRRCGSLRLRRQRECAYLQHEENQGEYSAAALSGEWECHSEDRLRVMLLSFNTVRAVGKGTISLCCFWN